MNRDLSPYESPRSRPENRTTAASPSVLIVEDEAMAAIALQQLLEQTVPEFRLLGVVQSIDEAVAWFRSHPAPELVFMDIHLADGLSFAIFDEIELPCPVIFTTAYDQYALRAFEVNSIDYILKPVDETRLLEAIVKYETMFGNRPAPTDTVREEYLNNLMDALQSRNKRYRTRFLISGADRFRPLQVDDIAYFYSENKITFAVTHTSQEHIIELPLNRLYEQLDPDRFFRANRQMIIGIDSITHIEPYFNGKVSVKVQPPFKSLITISEEKVTAFKLWMNY